MTLAKIEYEAANGVKKTLKIRPRQSVIVGASNSADIRLLNQANVAPRQCKIDFNGETCVATDLVERKRCVWVDGEPIKSVQLGDGDSLKIGENQIKISIPSESTSDQPVLHPRTVTGPSEKQGQTILQAEANESSSPVVKHLKFANGVTCFHLDSEKKLLDSFTETDERWDCGVVFIHQATDSEAATYEEENLLKDAPSNITDSKALYYRPYEDFSSASDFAGQHSSVLTFSQKGSEKPDYADKLKFVGTWFVNPEGLQFHLMNGTDFFTSQIFDLFDLLIFGNAKESVIHVFVTSPTVEDWNTLLSYIRGR